MSQRIDLAELKEGVTVPFFVSGRCPSCYPRLLNMKRKGLIPKDSEIDTVVVDRTRLFGYRCINPKCENRRENMILVGPVTQDIAGTTAHETLKCFLRQRDFDLASMGLKFEDEVWVDRNGHVDLDDPHMERYISLTYGPLRDCAGTLEWDDYRDEDGAEWLKCSSCDAKYKSYVLSYTSSVTGRRHRDHLLYELIPTDGRGAWRMHKRGSDSPTHTFDVPLDWALTVTEIRHPKLMQVLIRSRQ